MFSKISRYRKLADVTAPDARGRVLAARDVRLMPAVTGTFRHTVHAGDRLDQLAYTYYGEPLQWWSICDANPDFVSPLSLLDQEPVATTRFPVSIEGSPPWAAVIRPLRGTVGVEKVVVVEDVELVPKPLTVSGQTVMTFAERPARAVVVTYNRINVTAAALAAAITAAGFQVSPYVELDQVGQDIVIPPKPIG